MIVSTTPTIQGKEIREYLGAVTGEAVVGVDLDYEVIREGMLMVAVSGTAVRLD